MMKGEEPDGSSVSYGADNVVCPRLEARQEIPLLFFELKVGQHSHFVKPRERLYELRDF